MSWAAKCCDVPRDSKRCSVGILEKQTALFHREVNISPKNLAAIEDVPPKPTNEGEHGVRIWTRIVIGVVSSELIADSKAEYLCQDFS